MEIASTRTIVVNMSAILACLVPLLLATFLVWMEKLEKAVLRTGVEDDSPASTPHSEAEIPPSREDLPTTDAG